MGLGDLDRPRMLCGWMGEGSWNGDKCLSPWECREGHWQQSPAGSQRGSGVAWAEGALTSVAFCWSVLLASGKKWQGSCLSIVRAQHPSNQRM